MRINKTIKILDGVGKNNIRKTAIKQRMVKVIFLKKNKFNFNYQHDVN